LQPRGRSEHAARVRESLYAATSPTAFWCPFSGPIEPERVRPVVTTLIDAGCSEICIADTIGAATPRQVADTLAVILRDVPAEMLGVHFHDTRGTALANVLEAVGMGITTVDAAAGGLGGCPFAPGAQGNVATEDVVYMLQGMGIETGIALERLRAASLELQKYLAHPLPSRYLTAGPPPEGNEP
jgi:hydroxymethylglutaryl-CoA lyase